MNYPVKTDISVAWGEMDAFGHVNNVVFFRYFETLRIAYFGALLDKKVTSEDFTPILAQTECQYVRPVYFPDVLQGSAAVTHIGRTSLTMEYQLHSKEQDELVAQGKAVVVNVDRTTGKGRPLSDEFKEQIRRLQS